MRRIAAVLITAGCAGLVAGCDVNRALDELSRARTLAADLLVQFTTAADAANRAVMADTDAASVEYAREAETAKQAVQKDVDTLRPLLSELKFADESQLLQQFVDRYAKYKALDATILQLAVENTNLKAQRLSYGSGQAAADSFEGALHGVQPGSAKDEWPVKALVADAIASVREIQVLQAPHIADPDEGAMSKLEQRMAFSEADARGALERLTALIQPASRAKLSAATAALDQFLAVNKEIVGLSRRNTNVRSLALSLNEKRPLTTACDQSLRALNEALSKRGYQRGRWE